eukprot:COSAG01_NODE_57063_length_314_cov_1.674419_1_plen_40_part_10
MVRVCLRLEGVRSSCSPLGGSPSSPDDAAVGGGGGGGVDG